MELPSIRWARMGWATTSLCLVLPKSRRDFAAPQFVCNKPTQHIAIIMMLLPTTIIALHKKKYHAAYEEGNKASEQQRGG